MGTEDRERIESQIADLSSQVADLYGLLARCDEARADLLNGRGPLSTRDEYERLRVQLEEALPEREAIGAEIMHLTKQISAFRELLLALDGSKNDGNKTQDTGSEVDEGWERVYRLRQELLRIADSQIDAIRRWNEDPCEDKRGSFEDELSRLHDEYGRVMSDLESARREV